jgi:hypothetical protein
VCVCVFVAVSSFFLDGKMVDFAQHCSILLPFFSLGIDVDGALSSWKRVSCFETKRKGLFGDFLPIHDDFAIKNATNIIFKAEKAQSYSYLHDRSNGAKCCTCLC